MHAIHYVQSPAPFLRTHAHVTLEQLMLMTASGQFFCHEQSSREHRKGSVAFRSRNYLLQIVPRVIRQKSDPGSSSETQWLVRESWRLVGSKRPGCNAHAVRRESRHAMVRTTQSVQQ